MSYNTVLKGYAQVRDLEKCFKVVERLADSMIEPDDVTYGILLDACIADHDLDRAIEVIDRLIASGCPMNTVLFTTFMKGFVRADMIHKALALYHTMQSQASESGGVKPDVITYSVLIKGCCDKRRLESALRLLEDMLQEGIEADDIIANHLLEGCCHVSNCDLGAQLFEDIIVKKNVKPSPYTLSTMVKLYGKCGRCSEALKFVSEMEANFAQKPSVVIYTCLMSGCIRNKQHQDSWHVFEMMKSNGILPDKMTYTTLLQGCVQGQKWDLMIPLIEEAYSQYPVVNLPAEALNAALAAMLGKSQVETAVVLHRRMMKYGVPVTVPGIARRLKLTSPIPRR